MSEAEDIAGDGPAPPEAPREDAGEGRAPEPSARAAVQTAPTMAAAGLSGPAAPAGDPYLGRIIGERYLVIERLGEGGMGLVFRGEHTLMRKPVAIKLLHRELGAVDDAVERFRREAQSASRLSHPSIVTVTDFGRAEGGELFLVMEYIAGRPLSELVADGRFEPRRAVAVARLMLRGLAHAHAAGVVHRDLKPANIMIQGTGDGAETVKILDFGIAKMTETGDDGGQVLTRGGMIFGTPSYMSPEQATGQDVDHRADLYACGVILYEMLTGRKPFVADDLVKVMAQQVTAPPPPFARAAPGVDIPAPLEAVVMKALSKGRETRFQSAIEFLDALDDAEQARDPLAVWRVRWHKARTITEAQARAVWGDPTKRRVALGALGVFVALLSLSALFGEPAIEPKPVVKELAVPLKQAETLLAQGKLPAAKGILLQQLSKHPRSGRIHLQLGTIAFLENDPGRGLEHYRDAIEHDGGLRGDPALLLNVKALLDHRQLAEDALGFLIEKVGKPAHQTLAEVASLDKRITFRTRARDACDELDCLNQVDLVESYSLDLKQEKTCAKKREAVQALGETGDARAVPILKSAIRTRGSALHRLFGIQTNDCIRKDVKAALDKLGAGEGEGN